MSGMLITFILLVFLAVFLLVQGLVVPTFGEGAQTRKLLKRRLAEIESEAGEGSFVSLLRQHYLDDLSPFQRALEELPGMARLRQLIQQAGGSTPAWRIALLSLALGAIAGVVALAMLRQPLLALFASGAGLAAPVVRLTLQRKNRMDQFEKSLPDAIDLIKRALRAGQPLSTAIKLVGEDMEGQIGDEFRTVAADLN